MSKKTKYAVLSSCVLGRNFALLAWTGAPDSRTEIKKMSCLSHPCLTFFQFGRTRLEPYIYWVSSYLSYLSYLYIYKSNRYRYRGYIWPV